MFKNKCKAFLLKNIFYFTVQYVCFLCFSLYLKQIYINPVLILTTHCNKKINATSVSFPIVIIIDGYEEHAQ